jgi:hypothetical protein
VAHFYSISPLEVETWKGRELQKWYDEGLKLWEKLTSYSGCPWNQKQ